jgi:cation transport regulator
MPYRSVSELPESVRSHLPAKAQRMFMHIVNTQEERGLSTERAFASAWAQVKQHYRQDPETQMWHEIDKTATTMEIPISKADDARQLVFGWASVAVAKDGTPVIDLQGDVIAIEDLEAAMYAYVQESGELNFDHAGATRGQLVEALVFTPDKLEKMGIPAGTVPLGAWVGYHLPDQADYTMAKDGGLLMFSIEGRGVREDLNDAGS